MKWLFMFLAAQSISLSAQCLEIPITFTDVAVPSEVNKSADAVVVLSGMFPNSCYKLQRTDVRHPDQYTHEIIAFAEVSDEVCLMQERTMRIYNFILEVPLGMLPPGEHKVVVRSGDGKVYEESMTVQ